MDKDREFDTFVAKYMLPQPVTYGKKTHDCQYAFIDISSGGVLFVYTLDATYTQLRKEIKFKNKILLAQVPKNPHPDLKNKRELSDIVQKLQAKMSIEREPNGQEFYVLKGYRFTGLSNVELAKLKKKHGKDDKLKNYSMTIYNDNNPFDYQPKIE